MSRSGYTDWGPETKSEQWAYICYRGAVKSAIKGKHGQEFIKEVIAALDSLDVKKLISYELEENGQYCTLGAVGKSRGLNMSDVDIDDYDAIANLFGIPVSLAREIMFMNDEGVYIKSFDDETGRFRSMRQWLVDQLKSKD